MAQQLAPLPDTVPELPEAFVPRAGDKAQVLEVLLLRPAADGGGGGGGRRVLAHGMGGLGKTTMAVAVARTPEIRARYTRIGFVSAGQEPAVLELQRVLYGQLVGSPLAAKEDATPSTQRQLLQEAAVGKAWLLVLDDIWSADQERLLNFVDPAEPGHSVFVTTRFSKLLPGYAEVPLGLLSEPEAVSIVLRSACLPRSGAALALPWRCFGAALALL